MRIRRSRRALGERPRATSPWHRPRRSPVPDHPPAAEQSTCPCAAGGLAAAARRSPSAIAVEDPGRRRTYARLLDDVSRCAQGLRELGVRPGHRVAILTGGTLESVIAFHAALRIGAVAVMHDPASTGRELRRAFEDHAAVVAIVGREAADPVDRLPPDLHPKAVVAVDPILRPTDRLRTAAREAASPLRTLRSLRDRRRDGGSPGQEQRIPWTQLLASTPLPAQHRCPAPRDLAVLQYTIGPDGDQLGAMLTHENLVAGAAQIARLWGRGAGPARTVCSTLPLHEACGAPVVLIAPLLGGHRLMLTATAEEVLAAASRAPLDVIASAPAVLSRLCPAPETTPNDGAGVRREAVGEDTASGPAPDPSPLPPLHPLPRAIVHQRPLPADLAKRWEAASGAPITVAYARAECGIALAADYDPARPRSLGAPLRGVHVARGGDGLLQVAGPQVFHGYWNRPDETAHSLFGDGWTSTGDEVEPFEDGIVLRRCLRPRIETPAGWVVSPREIAGALLGHPAVAEAIALPRDLPDGGQEAEALVVLREGTAAEEAELAAWAAARLAPAKRPVRIRTVASLPGTPPAIRRTITQR